MILPIYDILEWNGTAQVLKNQIRKILLHCNVFKTENSLRWSSWSLLNGKMRHLKEPLRFDIANMYCLDIKKWNGTENLKINQLGKKLLHRNYYKTENPQKGVVDQFWMEN